MKIPDPTQIGCGGWSPPRQAAEDKAEEIEKLIERIDSIEAELYCHRNDYRAGWKDAFQAVRYELEDMAKPACPRCGRCGFIEDADMNLAGVCPECHGAAGANLRHNADMEARRDTHPKQSDG